MCVAHMLWTGIRRTWPMYSIIQKAPKWKVLLDYQQHQARLQASIGKLMWFQGIVLFKTPYIKLLEKIGNISVLPGYHPHQNTLFTIPQENASTKKIHMFLKSIFMFSEFYWSNKVISKKYKRAGSMARTSQLFKRELWSLT